MKIDLTNVDYVEKNRKDSIKYTFTRDFVTSTPIGSFEAQEITTTPQGDLIELKPPPHKLSQLKLPWGHQETRIRSIRFYSQGNLREITLQDSAQMEAHTIVGTFPLRNSVCFWPTGFLKSINPAVHVKIPTPIGPVDTFSGKVKFKGEDNTICFSQDGTIDYLYTQRIALEIRIQGVLKEYLPQYFWPNQENPMLKIRFHSSSISVNDEEILEIPYEDLLCFSREYSPLPPHPESFSMFTEFS